MTDHPLLSAALASARELTEADERLRVLTRAGLAVPPAELNALCYRVVRLAQEWEQIRIRLQIISN